MDALIYTIVGGLIVAAVCALARLAFRDYRAFDRLRSRAFPVGWAIMITAWAFIGGGIIRGIELLTDGLQKDPNSPIKAFDSTIQKLDHLRSMGKWSYFLVVGLYVSLFALALLPRIVILNQDDATKTQPVGKPGSVPKKRPRREEKKNSDMPTE